MEMEDPNRELEKQSWDRSEPRLSEIKRSGKAYLYLDYYTGIRGLDTDKVSITHIEFSDKKDYIIVYAKTSEKQRQLFVPVIDEIVERMGDRLHISTKFSKRAVKYKPIYGFSETNELTIELKIEL